ncbi:YrhK-like protein [Halobacillus dabanensis]|uniref:YrhK-like protein n=1 Tax=Halobacillus dabanensis TaxID=240302 RepID=A0A1I3RR22_HALDA|nr:YrhK family protein [Halobacillus dabanensis]SFJ48159.1 YrhK-like protein [Halobacillus dabanensis]
MSDQKSDKQKYVDFHLGKHELFINKNYEMLYTINDFLLGIWFLVGSIFFYFEHLKHWGVTLFVLGSIQMLIRPTIRLIHNFHLRKEYAEKYEKKKDE